MIFNRTRDNYDIFMFILSTFQALVVGAIITYFEGLDPVVVDFYGNTFTIILTTITNATFPFFLIWILPTSSSMLIQTILHRKS